jgi:hypothetical protein
MDWSAIALAVKRANAAYIESDDQSKAAFEALGDTWVGQFQDQSHQACLSVDAAGACHLSISGTRATALALADIFADVSLDPVSVKGGNVTRGVYEGMQNVWDWALRTVTSGTVFNVSGHSLGASRTHLTPLFIPASQIGSLHSFEAPKFCDAQFYAYYAPELSQMVCVLNGRDTWAAWPWIDPRWQSRPQHDHVWLKKTGFSIIPWRTWVGAGSFSDHSCDEVQSRIEAICLSQQSSGVLSA